MNDDGRTSNIHLHIGGLILLIIITLLLFKVNIKGAINSPQFQNNLNYIEDKSEYAWKHYVIDPLTSFWKIAYEAVPQSLKQPQGTVNKSDTSANNLPSLDIHLNSNNQETYQFSRPVGN